MERARRPESAAAPAASGPGYSNPGYSTRGVRSSPESPRTIECVGSDFVTASALAGASIGRLVAGWRRERRRVREISWMEQAMTLPLP